MDPRDLTGDDELLNELAAGADPPPVAWLEAGRAAWSWRTIDAELAELVFDSVDDPAALVGVRGGPDVRQLSFEGGEVGVELEVGPGTSPRLNGQLVPPQPGRIEVRGPQQLRVVVDSDELGRFAVPAVPRGPISLRCTLPRGGGAAAVDTGWVLI